MSNSKARFLLMAALIAQPATWLFAADPPPANPDKIAAVPNQVRGDEITPAQQHAVEKGLAWLADHQAADGSFGVGQQGAGAAITALAGLAFMEAGNLPGRGKYAENVSRCQSFILDSCQESGLIAAPQAQSPMYGHGFATLFLAEVYGMTGDDNIKEKLQKAVALIERTQSTQPGNDGGWRYQPVPTDADISVTICQVMALRAARDSGIKVEKDVVDKAIKYVRACQNADGGFSYMASMGGGGGSAFPRSAAGVAALYYAGVFEGTDLQRGLKYVKEFTPGHIAGAVGPNGQPMDVQGFYFYGHYYAVQAMFLAGGDYWNNWYPAIRNELIARQSPLGNWSGDFTDDYATSMALIILQMPNRYLPVYSGKGPGS